MPGVENTYQISASPLVNPLQGRHAFVTGASRGIGKGIALQLAKATVWMATTPEGANQNFNVTNGDVFRWSHLWPKFADYFGLEPGSVKTVDLVSYMADKAPVWDRVVEKHDLVRQPFNAVAMWSYGRHLWMHDWDIVSSMTKARLAGFRDFVDSEEMFFRLFDHFRRVRVLP